MTSSTSRRSCASRRWPFWKSTTTVLCSRRLLFRNRRSSCPASPEAQVGRARRVIQRRESATSPRSRFPTWPPLTKISVPNTDYYGKMTPVETIQGVPLWKPPYGRITAIDLNTGDHRWMTPAGDLAQSNPVLRQLGLRGLGRAARGHLLLTKTLLIVGQEGGTHREGGSPEEVPDFEIRDPKLSAYDKETGKVV